jgi:hypothetical protein
MGFLEMQMPCLIVMFMQTGTICTGWPPIAASTEVVISGQVFDG